MKVLEDPRVFKDVEDQQFNQLFDTAFRHHQGANKFYVEAGKRLEQLQFNKENICGQLKFEGRKRGATEGQLEYIRQICQPFGWTRHYDNTNKPSELGLENLTLPDLDNKISDEELNELLKLRSDAMTQIALHDLTFDQVKLLSVTEKQQYRDIRAKLFSQEKAHIDHGKNNFESKMSILGLLSKEDRDKKSTLTPPKELWGESDTYWYLKQLADQHDTIGKYLQDVANRYSYFN